jgi:hypothetical protein
MRRKGKQWREFGNPAIEELHVLVLALTVGPILICDVRLITDVLRKRPASEVVLHLIAGFAFITGSCWFGRAP